MNKFNYIQQFNRFWDRARADGLSSSARLVYIALFQTNNRCGWKSRFKAVKGSIMDEAGISSKSTYYKALEILEKTGYITWEHGANDHAAATISLVVFDDDFNLQDNSTVPKYGTVSDRAPSKNDKIDHPTVLNNGTVSGTVSGTILKHKTVNNSSYSSSRLENTESLCYTPFKDVTDLEVREQEKKEKSCAKKEKAQDTSSPAFTLIDQHNGPPPSALEADLHLQKHYPSLYNLVSQNNLSARTPEQRLEMLEQFWAENLDEYRVKMPPWKDVIRHFRNWVPKYTKVKESQQQPARSTVRDNRATASSLDTAVHQAQSRLSKYAKPSAVEAALARTHNRLDKYRNSGDSATTSDSQ